MSDAAANTPLRIIHLEDNPADRELVKAVLEADGVACDIQYAETHEEFERVLQRSEPNLIISDFTLPSFDGLKALALARRKRPAAPFIFFSGTIGEEVAVESLKNGATDYILKDR